MSQLNYICPIRSISGRREFCTEQCMWFDSEEKKCAVEMINRNLRIVTQAIEENI